MKVVKRLKIAISGASISEVRVFWEHVSAKSPEIS